VNGRIHSYESFAAADGPGVRFLVFLSGCPFRCAYCHNPDTWAGKAAFDASPEEVLEKAVKYKEYWGDEGGITLSGGEPLLQSQFSLELFSLAHQKGINTCLDTSGANFDRNDSTILKLLSLTDTVMLDIKHMDPQAHERLTGHKNQQVLDCAKYVSETGGKLWIRRVLVPGITDNMAELRKLGDFIRALGNVERFEILPYHTLGREKWNKLGLSYPLEGIRTPTTEEVDAAYDAVMQAAT
jgi:pyruvate formate lyase activating enzyme